MQMKIGHLSWGDIRYPLHLWDTNFLMELRRGLRFPNDTAIGLIIFLVSRVVAQTDLEIRLLRYFYSPILNIIRWIYYGIMLVYLKSFFIMCMEDLHPK